MSRSDAAALSTCELASEMSRRFADAADGGHADDVPDGEIGRVFVEAARLLAARAQQGKVPPLVSGNSRLSATDAVIAATAILESVGVEVFELAAWQAVSNIGSSRQNANRQLPGDLEQ